jgi:hypothetical protein
VGVSERARVEVALDETLAAALGRDHRDDPALPGSGGPAGNARLTAWTGLVLLVLFLAELVTLLDIHGLISWHLALGVVLIPPALLKTVTTGWRILQYYRGDAPYHAAGPPPLLLRVLGPLVILSTLALLGTGTVLILLGQSASRQPLFSALGQRVDWITLHQGSFIVWAVATGLHVLGRLIPAWQLTLTRTARVTRPPGAARRGAALLVVGALAVACVGWVLLHQGGWNDQRDFGHGSHHGDGAAAIHRVL